MDGSHCLSLRGDVESESAEYDRKVTDHGGIRDKKGERFFRLTAEVCAHPEPVVLRLELFEGILRQSSYSHHQCLFSGVVVIAYSLDALSS